MIAYEGSTGHETRKRQSSVSPRVDSRIEKLGRGTILTLSLASGTELIIR